MLKTTYQTGKAAFCITFDDLDENFLSELSFDEASEITGGFTLVNNTGSTRGFYILGEFVPAQAEVLQPGESNSYNGDQILYSSSLTDYQPVLSQKISPTASVSFRQLGTDGVFIGDGGNVFSPTD